MHENECRELAKQFFDLVGHDEEIYPCSATGLHSDNLAPIRPITLSAQLMELGFEGSFSWSLVNNGNAYVKSRLSTMKNYQIYLLLRFQDLLTVRAW
jgi:hypothetical protein